MANEIFVTYRIDDQEFKVDLNKLAATAEKAGKESGNKFGSSLGNSAAAAFGGVQGKLIAAAAAIVGALSFRGAINEAIKAENALNELNTSLKLAGTFSSEASKRFVDLANEIQKTTTISSDQVLGLAALARNYTTTNEQAEKLTKATIQLSAANGKDLNANLQTLGKTLQGNIGLLGNSIPGLKNVSDTALKAGAAIDFVNTRFSTAAESKVRTFDGAISVLSNSFNDVSKSIGNIFVKSPTLVKIIGDLGDLFSKVADKISGFFQGKDPFKFLALRAIDFVNFMVTIFGPAIEDVFNILSTAINAFGFAVNSLVFGIGSSVGKLVSIFAPDSETAIAIQSFTSQIGSNLDTFAEKTNAAFNSIGSTDKTEGIVLALQRYRDELANAELATESGVNGINDKLKGLDEKGKKSVNALGQAFYGGLANTVTRGTEAIVKSLLKGGKGFEDFTKVVLGTLGDMAIQMGSVLIAIGIGMESLHELEGAKAVLAGIGLVALGTILKAFSGGSESSSSSPESTSIGSQSPGGLIGNEVPATEIDQVEAKPRTEFNLIVQGNILDRRESGLAILDILRETADSNDIVIGVA